MSDLRLLVRLQARVMTFLGELSPDLLRALAEGRAGLAVVDGSSHVPLPGPVRDAIPEARPSSTRTPPAPRTRSGTASVPGFDAARVTKQLLDCENLDQGTELLADLRLNLPQLKAIAAGLNLTVSGTKDALTRRILSLTIGNRRKHDALKQG